MSTIPDGRSLELYFIDGRPDGMLTAEVFNWTGHVLMTPRTRIAAALARREARCTGVYILLGELDGEQYAYIGEGEDISDRIRSHDTKKDWWTSAVLVTSSSNSLNKAHVKYLEARLVEEARSVGRAILDNNNTPPRPSLTEAARSNMEGFIGYLLMVLPALRVDIFIRNTRPTIISNTLSHKTASEARFSLISRKNNLSARAFLSDGDFIVETGSQARMQWEGSTTKHTSYATLHAELCKTGILQEQGSIRVFTQNYAFSSPSAAAAVVLGRPSNGPLEWRAEDGSGTYRDWEAKHINEPSVDEK